MMGIANTRTQDEVDRLMQQLSSLPKATTDATPASEKKANDNWKRKTTTKIRSSGRVNRTKGK